MARHHFYHNGMLYPSVPSSQPPAPPQQSQSTQQQQPQSQHPSYDAYQAGQNPYMHPAFSQQQQQPPPPPPHTLLDHYQQQQQQSQPQTSPINYYSASPSYPYYQPAFHNFNFSQPPPPPIQQQLGTAPPGAPILPPAVMSGTYDFRNNHNNNNNSNNQPPLGNRQNPISFFDDDDYNYTWSPPRAATAGAGTDENVVIDLTGNNTPPRHHKRRKTDEIEEQLRGNKYANEFEEGWRRAKSVTPIEQEQEEIKGKPVPLSSPLYSALETTKTYLSTLLAAASTPSDTTCPHHSSHLSSILSSIATANRKTTITPYFQLSKSCTIKCSQQGCQKMVCLGCAERLSSNDHFCPAAHLLAIVLVLAKIDSRWLLQQKEKEKEKEAASTRSSLKRDDSHGPRGGLHGGSAYRFGGRASGPRAMPSGTGYAADDYDGLQFYPYTNRDPPGIKAKLSKGQEHQSSDNTYFTSQLRSLVDLLSEDHELADFSVSLLMAEFGETLSGVMKASCLGEAVSKFLGDAEVMDIEASSDSDEDEGKWELYGAIMPLLRGVAGFELLLKQVVMQKGEKKVSPGIAGLVELKKEDKAESASRGKRKVVADEQPTPKDVRLLDDEATPSIWEVFEKLEVGCGAFMKNAGKLATAGVDEEMARLLAFCLDVDSTAIAVRQHVQILQSNERSPSHPYNVQSDKDPKGKGKATTPEHSPAISIASSAGTMKAEEDEEKEPASFGLTPEMRKEIESALAGHLQFKYVTSVANTHFKTTDSAESRYRSDDFSDEEDFGFNSDDESPPLHSKLGGRRHDDPLSVPRNPQKMKRLMKELTILSSNLPAGIYVRVQEDRPELLKALIVGPEGTPYEGGLYEFDFYIPDNFPSGPPKVVFKTTGVPGNRGRVRMNPNLYEGGKVCLSILGTWEGSTTESWQPSKSTLLQVLVSIQAMILCAEPYYNEPGSEMSKNERGSRQYTERVRGENMRCAVAGWLKDCDENKNGLWKDVVKAHFLLNTPGILKVAEEWIEEMKKRDADGESSGRRGMFWDDDISYDFAGYPIEDEEDDLDPGDGAWSSFQNMGSVGPQSGTNVGQQQPQQSPVNPVGMGPGAFTSFAAPTFQPYPPPPPHFTPTQSFNFATPLVHTQQQPQQDGFPQFLSGTAHYPTSVGDWMHGINLGPPPGFISEQQQHMRQHQQQQQQQAQPSMPSFGFGSSLVNPNGDPVTPGVFGQPSPQQIQQHQPARFVVDTSGVVTSNFTPAFYGGPTPVGVISPPPQVPQQYASTGGGNGNGAAKGGKKSGGKKVPMKKAAPKKLVVRESKAVKMILDAKKEVEKVAKKEWEGWMEEAGWRERDE